MIGDIISQILLLPDPHYYINGHRVFNRNEAYHMLHMLDYGELSIMQLKHAHQLM